MQVPLGRFSRWTLQTSPTKPTLIISPVGPEEFARKDWKIGVHLPPLAPDKTPQEARMHRQTNSNTSEASPTINLHNEMHLALQLHPVLATMAKAKLPRSSLERNHLSSIAPLIPGRRIPPSSSELIAGFRSTMAKILAKAALAAAVSPRKLLVCPGVCSRARFGTVETF